MTVGIRGHIFICHNLTLEASPAILLFQFHLFCCSRSIRITANTKYREWLVCVGQKDTFFKKAIRVQRFLRKSKFVQRKKNKMVLWSDQIFLSKYPPAKLGALRLLVPQRDLTAIGKESNPPSSPFVKRGKSFPSLWYLFPAKSRQREVGRDF